MEVQEICKRMQDQQAQRSTDHRERRKKEKEIWKKEHKIIYTHNSLRTHKSLISITYGACLHTKRMSTVGTHKYIL